jgi:predicted nucleic acid-binding protein
MKFLLDTNIVSELRKKSPNEGVCQWISDASTDMLYISCITLGEIQKGVIKKARTDIASSAILENWLEKIIESYLDKTLSIDKDISLKWGAFIATAGMILMPS